MSKRCFKFDKLIRDKIPGMMRSADCTVHDKKLQGAELVAALKNKLLEEVHEVMQANSDEALKEELADLIEVVYAIGSVHKFDLAQIEKIRTAKNLHKGSFADGIYVSYIEIDENNPEINRYLANRKHYPEIKK